MLPEIHPASARAAVMDQAIPAVQRDGDLVGRQSTLQDTRGTRRFPYSWS